MKKILVMAAFVSITACTKTSNSNTKADFLAKTSSTAWAPKDGHIRLAVLGDSLAAALLADTFAGQERSAETFMNFVGGTMMISSTTGPYKKKTAHEISQEMDRMFAKTELGAFAGTQRYSFSNQLKQKYEDAEIAVRQYSVSGARTSTLQPQIDAMRSDYQTKNVSQADIVVMHVGGNDWCDMRTTTDFETDLHKNVKSVMEVNPTAQILVLSVPDMVSVMSTPDHGVQQNPSTALPFSCPDVRRTTNTCMKRGIKMGASESEVAAQRQSLNEFNAAVSNVVTKVSTEVPTFSGKVLAGANYGQKIAYKYEWLAVDCFHPSKKGQEIIGELAGKDLSILLGK